MSANLPNSDEDFVAVLQRLRPATFVSDWPAVRLEAAQRAGKRSVNIWRCVSLALAVGFTGSLAIPRSRTCSHDTVIARLEPVPAPLVARAPGPGSYGVLRTRVLQEGVDSLPVLSVPETTGPSAGAWRSSTL